MQERIARERRDTPAPDPETAPVEPALDASRPQAVLALQQSAGNHAVGRVLQRMSVRSTKSKAVVSSDTRKKHVCAVDAQEAEARGGFGPRTFVASESILTNAVDQDDHDFTEAATTPSARFDFQANIPVHQFEKTEGPPAGWAKGKPVNKTCDGEEKACEIGAIKGGDDIIKVTHFKMII